MIEPGHVAVADDLVIKWNAMLPSPATLDLVLHLHGYSQNGAAMQLIPEKLSLSGLDFADPEAPPGRHAGRRRPTLGILPRGRHFGGRSGFGYDFPSLLAPGGPAKLIARALAAFATGYEVWLPERGRRILTAHSGGGAALMPVARQWLPDEIHVFDALYSPAPDLLAMARRMLAQPETDPALRVLYVSGSETEAASLELARGLAPMLASAPGLATRFRVEPVPTPHALIGRVYGWRLLANGGAAIV